MVWDLDDDVGDQERGPAIGLAGAFTDFVQGALDDEAGHDLLDQGGEDCRQHEDAEDCVLQALEGEFGAVEGEADEEGG